MLQSREGQRVPAVSFRVRENNEWKTVTTAQLFDGKTVVVFSLRGAFADLFVDPPAALQRAGAGVRRAWRGRHPVRLGQRHLRYEQVGQGPESENITMIPDGNGEFTEGMGMLVDKADLGFGKRSWRYAMLVRTVWCRRCSSNRKSRATRSGVGRRHHAQPHRAQRQAPRPVVVFSKVGCSFCAKAKQLLDDNGFDYIDVPLENKIRGKVLGAVSGTMTAPQVFINGKLVGGAEALERYGTLSAAARRVPAGTAARGLRTQSPDPMAACCHPARRFADSPIGARAERRRPIAPSRTIPRTHRSRRAFPASVPSRSRIHATIVTDVAVIGAGTAGLAAYRAARPPASARDHRGRSLRYHLRPRRLHALKLLIAAAEARTRSATPRPSACMWTARCASTGAR